MPGILTERQQFVGGWKYTYSVDKENEALERITFLDQLLYQNEWENMNYFRKNNVHWFVIIKDISQYEVSLQNKYEPQYENSKVLIYYID